MATTPYLTVILPEGKYGTWVLGDYIGAAVELVEDHVGPASPGEGPGGFDVPHIRALLSDGSLVHWAGSKQEETVAQFIERRYGAPDWIRD